MNSRRTPNQKTRQVPYCAFQLGHMVRGMSNPDQPQVLPLTKLLTETTLQHRRRIGVCTRCGGDRQGSFLQTCPACSAAEKERNQARAGRVKETNAARRLKLKTSGICITCGVAPATEGQECQPCHDRNTELRRARDIAKREGYEAAGLCTACGAPRDRADRKLCSKCLTAREKTNNASRERHGNVTYRTRREHNLCLSCATPLSAFPGHSKAWCPTCYEAQAEERRAYRKERYDRLKSQQCCTVCGITLEEGETLNCTRCRTYQRASSLKFRSARDAVRDTAGQCRYCSQPRWGTATSCQYHYIDASVRNFCTDKEQREALIEHLQDQFVLQEAKCAYTGLQLEPGKNVSVEHIYPRSSHPELACEPTNLVLVDTAINTMKMEMEPENPRFDVVWNAETVKRLRDLAAKVVRPAPASNACETTTTTLVSQP